MTTVFYYVVLPLLPLAAIVYVVWSYRKKAAEKEAASAERMAALMMNRPAAGGAPAPAAAPQRPAAGPVAGAVVGAPVAAAAAPPAPRHERLLSRPETLLYYLLKAGLADHEVFPKVSLAAVVEIPENPFPQSPGGRVPAQHDFDFVICDKSMRVVAVVQLHGQAAGPWAELVYRRLSAAGIRMLRVDPAALPRREQVRALVLGRSA